VRKAGEEVRNPYTENDKHEASSALDSCDDDDDGRGTGRGTGLHR